MKRCIAAYTEGSGNFGDLLGRLRSLGFIDYPAPGKVVAASILFPEVLP